MKQKLVGECGTRCEYRGAFSDREHPAHPRHPFKPSGINISTLNPSKGVARVPTRDDTLVFFFVLPPQTFAFLFPPLFLISLPCGWKCVLLAVTRHWELEAQLP